MFSRSVQGVTWASSNRWSKKQYQGAICTDAIVTVRVRRLRQAAGLDVRKAIFMDAIAIAILQAPGFPLITPPILQSRLIWEET